MVSFGTSLISPANVSTVPQRSPLRYPGGKTWLVPHVRSWLQVDPTPAPLLIEPFAGGATVSLTAVMERLVDRAVMVEIDRDVSAFWRAALEHGVQMIERVMSFNPDRTSVERMTAEIPRDVLDQGFRTLVMNRTRRGGVLAPGASLNKLGEKGNGLASRWYPDTLAKRLQDISDFADRLSFFEGDGLTMLEMFAEKSDVRLFIDPPYTAVGGKRAGTRLYTHNLVNHPRIFQVLAESSANFLMTYDCSAEIESLVRAHEFEAVVIEVKNSHHAQVPEFVITRDRLFA